MPNVRKPATPRPSRAQAAFLDRFEELYTSSQDQLEGDMTAARAEHPALAPKKSKKFSKSTYHSWKRQDTSPTLHDLEVLCALTGTCQTLLLDPALLSSEGEIDMEWLEDARRILDEMASLSPHQRSAVVGELRGIVQREQAKGSARNPRQSDEAGGPRLVRRSKISGPAT